MRHKARHVVVESQNVLKELMPFFTGLVRQWMPEELELMSSIIFCKMAPGIRKVLRNGALVKRSRVPRYRRDPSS
jgi:hypothetical protein